MDTIKLEEIEHTSNGDHIYAEKQTCLLEDSDIQCGHVFYNEITRLLKFYCTYCRETYDNIEYFCQHLSEHVKDIEEINHIEQHSQLYKQDVAGEVKCIEEDESREKSTTKLKKLSTWNSLTNDDEDTRDALEYEHHESETSSSKNETSVVDFDNIPIDDFDNSEMIIEEIEDADEIRAEIEQEMCQSMTNENYLFLPEANNSTEVINYSETSTTTTTATPDNVKGGNSFEDCFIKETNIDKIRSEGVCVIKEKKLISRKPLQKRRSNLQDLLRLKRRRKKVTTVKVIAVKNRIAELYERIRNEQQKSQQIFSNDFLNLQNEQETQDAIESLSNVGDATDNKVNILNSNQNIASEESKPANVGTELTRKIIGETLITLIPEGTKIPNKLPSPINQTLSTELRSDPVSPVITSTYQHKSYNTNEKKAICPACGKIFRSHFSLTIHKRIHYLESDSTVKLAHKCSDCDQLFNKLSQLKHHVERVHYPDGFICKICNRQLSSLSLLERHMVKVHLDRPFNCKQCNKNFSDPLTFEEHLASHNSGEIFKCSTCGRKYSTEFFLMEHMRNHKEQVPQTCVVCGKVTLRITQHMKIHTPRPKRLLSCTVCGKIFNFSSGLSHHFKIMHKLPRPPPKPKKESNPNTIKRKRRSRANERSTNKKKQCSNSTSANAPFIVNTNKFSNQIIEEQIEIPHDVYDNTAPSSIINVVEKEIHQNPTDIQRPAQAYPIINETHSCRSMGVERDQEQENFINHKEEEAKRVIVELIQSSTYTSFFPDNLSSVLEVAPPIAREETISAVNSIVHDC